MYCRMCMGMPCLCRHYTSEYWMIYRGPGFSPLWFGSSPTPSNTALNLQTREESFFGNILCIRYLYYISIAYETEIQIREVLATKYLKECASILNIALNTKYRTASAWRNAKIQSSNLRVLPIKTQQIYNCTFLAKQWTFFGQFREIRHTEPLLEGWHDNQVCGSVFNIYWSGSILSKKF